MKKHIICFGDSNTYGYKATGGRYDEETRWPMRMQKTLGDEYYVIEEGLNGRTCVFDDPVEGGFKSGAAFLPVALMSHAPVDLVIIMLGTNDLKQRFGMNPKTIGDSMMQLIKLCRVYGYNDEGKAPAILVVSPPPILDTLMRAGHAESFGKQAIAMSHDLSRELLRVTKLLRCHFMDAGEFAQPDPFDSVHLTREAHLSLGDAMARRVREILK